jgi:hypothetical protein
MVDNFREFEAGPDPFGNTWQVRFGWLQTATAIRHSDSVDAKFFLSNGEDKLEKVVAMTHPDLLALSEREDRPLTDPWCMKLAALHVKHMIETGGDMEKMLVTVSAEQLRRYAALLDEVAVSMR